MKVFVILMLPQLIPSKNMLIETEDSIDANDKEVSKDVKGKDYDHYEKLMITNFELNIETLKEYKNWCTTNSLQIGAMEVYCKQWAKKW